MSPLRRVFGERAGPSALGILVPPGQRTLLIVRPRALPWDLLLVQPGEGNVLSTSFRELDRDEAEATAEQLCRALEEWIGGGPGQVEAVPSAAGDGYCICALVGQFPLIACLRLPGQAYRPMVCATLDEARAAVASMSAVLCPAADTYQEVYFNTRKFMR